MSDGMDEKLTVLKRKILNLKVMRKIEAKILKLNDSFKVHFKKMRKISTPYQLDIPIPDSFPFKSFQKQYRLKLK